MDDDDSGNEMSCHGVAIYQFQEDSCCYQEDSHKCCQGNCHCHHGRCVSSELSNTVCNTSSGLKVSLMKDIVVSVMVCGLLNGVG